MTDLAYMTIAEASRLIRARKLSPVELTAALLARIAALDGIYHAYIAVTADAARAEAKAAEAEIANGSWRGPMHGIPYAAKDIFDVAGTATTCHSKLRIDHRAAADSNRAENRQDAPGRASEQPEPASATEKHRKFEAPAKSAAAAGVPMRLSADRWLLVAHAAPLPALGGSKGIRDKPGVRGGRM